MVAAINLDARLPKAMQLAPNYAYSAAGVCNWGACVSQVLALGYIPQILRAVIKLVAVYVVYKVLRPDPSTHGENHPMRPKFVGKYRATLVSVLDARKCRFASELQVKRLVASAGFGQPPFPRQIAI